MVCPQLSNRAAIAAVLLCSVFPSLLAAAAETTVTSRIDRVTVYSTSAQVTRVARIDLDQGIHVLVFEKLPLPAREDALGCRVDGEGRVLGIGLASRDYGEPIEERQRGLERDLAAVTRQIEDLDAQIRVLDQRRAFLTSVQEAVPDALAANAAAAPRASPLPSLKGTLGFLTAEWGVLEADRLRLTRARAALNNRHGRLDADLAALRVPVPGERLLEARVELEVFRSGSLGLELSYLVPSATWRPLYDARLDRAAGRVEWTSYGEICQTSGEDWTGVELTVATSDAGRPTAPPALDPVFLAAGAAPPAPKMVPALARTEQRGIEEIVVEAKAQAVTMERADTHHSIEREALPALAAPLPKGGRGGDVVLVPGAVQQAPFPPPPPPAIALTGLGETAIGSFHRITRRESIPADGSWHRATIAAHTFPVELEVLAVPRKARLAYLTGRSTNQTGGPLLPGAVRLFSGGDFLGTAAIDRLVAPGAPVTLGFGSLDRVEVAHELVAEMRAETRRTTELRYRYRTRIKNYDDAALHVVVLDQIPVSTDERIEVRVDVVSPPASSAEPDARGTFRWEAELPAGGEKVIELEYEVRCPKEWQLAGF